MEKLSNLSSDDLCTDSVEETCDTSDKYGERLIKKEETPDEAVTSDLPETTSHEPLYIYQPLERLSIESLADEFSNKLKTAPSPTAVDEVIERNILVKPYVLVETHCLYTRDFQMH
ncbi:uncharacterized protein LOC144347771 [Saccoglossus kowalevskii]